MSDFETRITALLVREAESHHGTPNLDGVFAAADSKTAVLAGDLEPGISETLVDYHQPNAVSKALRWHRPILIVTSLLLVAVVGAVALRGTGRSTITGPGGVDTFDPEGLIPGLTADNEVSLIEVDPSSPGDPDDIAWEHAYLIEGLDVPIEIGRTGPAFAAAAAREDLTEVYECFRYAGSGGSGCGPTNDSGPTIDLFDMRVWSWTNVPDQAVVVVYTEPDGRVSWQRPSNGYVGFLDPEVGGCGDCRLDAYDINGDLIASADVAE